MLPDARQLVALVLLFLSGGASLVVIGTALISGLLGFIAVVALACSVVLLWVVL